MKIEVFVEDGTAAEKIAEFYDNDVYAKCIRKLETWATANNWKFITETVSEDES